MIERESPVINWLLGGDNQAVRYRTQTELLGQPGDKSAVAAWLNSFLPAGWENSKGLWFVYYLNSFAECGLTFADTGIDKEAAIGYGGKVQFDGGCGDYMRLRALVRLGLGGEPAVAEIIKNLPTHQVPDGGFLCLHRLRALKHTPKSCVKANMHALMFCAECAKKGIRADITGPLLDYFWNHRLFYRTDNPEKLILDAREGWRAVDAFYPFEVMRVGLQNIVEAFCALGFGNDSRLAEAWELLDRKKAPDGKCRLEGTLTKSYLPRERVNAPGKWVTFYAMLAEKERGAK